MSAWLRRISPVVLAAALLAVGAAPARAQTKETADNKAAAKEHYDKGRSFYDLGRYDDAIKEFEAAYELKNDPAFLYNLAQSYRQIGNHDQALHFYKTYLRYLPKGGNRADIEEKIKAEEQAVTQKGPGTGTTPPPANTTTPPANMTPPPTNTTPPPTNTTPPPTGTEPNVMVPPGTTAPPPGYTPPPTGPTPGMVMPSPTDPGRKFRIAGIASAGAGAVMWVVGIVEWRRAVKASSDVEDAAAAGQAFDPAVQSRASRPRPRSGCSTGWARWRSAPAPASGSTASTSRPPRPRPGECRWRPSSRRADPQSAERRSGSCFDDANPSFQ